MNSLELAKYYIDNKSEFQEEYGHEKLINLLKILIEPITEPYDVILGIDVGSCIGDYIDNMKHVCRESNANILCFEPNPMNISKLEPIINTNKNICLYKCCLSNETSITSFYNWKDLNYNHSGNGLGGLRSGGLKICDVKVEKLDDILDREYFSKNVIIKLLKIDTEGNDSNVIKGFEKYLPKTKYIIFECSDCLDDIRGPGILNPMKDIVDFLSSKGFDTYRIGTKKLFKVNDDYWNQIYDDVKFWSNCFAIKKDDKLIDKLIDKNFNYIVPPSGGLSNITLASGDGDNIVPASRGLSNIV